MLSSGDRVPPHDVLQLRCWAPSVEDALLSLEEIALRIIRQEERTSSHEFANTRHLKASHAEDEPQEQRYRDEYANLGEPNKPRKGTL